MKILFKSRQNKAKVLFTKWRRFRLLKMSQYEQMKGIRGNKTYMSFLRSSEELRGSPVQPVWPHVGKTSAWPDNWPRLTRIHTVYSPSFYVDAGGIIVHYHNLQFNFFFFSIPHLGFSKIFFMFLFSAIPLSICFSIAQQHWGYFVFFFSLTSKHGAIQHSAGSHSFMQWYVPCKVMLGQILKETSPCSDLF